MCSSDIIMSSSSRHVSAPADYCVWSSGLSRECLCSLLSGRGVWDGHCSALGRQRLMSAAVAMPPALCRRRHVGNLLPYSLSLRRPCRCQPTWPLYKAVCDSAVSRQGSFLCLWSVHLAISPRWMQCLESVSPYRLHPRSTLMHVFYRHTCKDFYRHTTYLAICYFNNFWISNRTKKSTAANKDHYITSIRAGDILVLACF